MALNIITLKELNEQSQILLTSRQNNPITAALGNYDSNVHYSHKRPKQVSYE
jgi:hypothetical protein